MAQHSLPLTTRTDKASYMGCCDQRLLANEIRTFYVVDFRWPSAFLQHVFRGFEA